MVGKSSVLGSLLLVVAGAAVASGAGAPLSLFLEPVAEGVAQGVSDEKCVAELQTAFGKKQWRLVGVPEQADARVEIRECVVHVRSRVSTKTKQGGGEIRGPQPGNKIIPGGARAVGSEHEYGAAMEEERLVLLVLRLSMGDRFADVSSDPRDERLKQAAGTVAKHAEAWLRHPEGRPPAIGPKDLLSPKQQILRTAGSRP